MSEDDNIEVAFKPESVEKINEDLTLKEIVSEYNEIKSRQTNHIELID